LVETEELAGVGHALVAPARAHDADGLVAPGAAAVEGRAERLDLLAHPADAGAEDHAAGGQVVEGGEHLAASSGGGAAARAPWCRAPRAR